MSYEYLDAADCSIRVGDTVTDLNGWSSGRVLDLSAGLVLVDWGDYDELVWEEPWDLYVV